MSTRLNLFFAASLFGFSPFCLSQDRTISFQSNETVGSLWSYDQPTPSEYLPGCLQFDWKGVMIGSASGDVRVPEAGFIGIRVDALDGNQNLLDQLPADSIDRLDLYGATITAGFLERIERIKSLRVLRLTDCRFDRELDTTGLQGLPLLQYLDCNGKEETVDNHRAMIEWVTKCPSLQYLWVSGSKLTAAEVGLFNRHPAPLFLTVRLDETSAETLAALADVPNLVGLNLYVGTDVSENYHRNLSDLKHVALINWSGGDLNDSLFQSLAGLDQLRTIRFQGDAKVTDSFIERLPELTRLTSITFSNTLLSTDQQSQLRESLIRMNRVREFPEIKNPSAELLAKLSRRGNLTRITLSGLGPDANTEQLANVLRANEQLKYVRLSNTEWTSELAIAICQCKQLVELRLSQRNFDGGLFPNLEPLRNLETLHLYVSEKARGLSALAGLPSLSSLVISLNTRDPDEWSFIADLPTLDHFEISSGYCDDRVGKWIRQCRYLTSFSDNRNGVMTDGVIDQFSKNEKLRSLSISGFISREGVERLIESSHLLSLSVSSNLLSETDKSELFEKYKYRCHIQLTNLSPTLGQIEIGQDGLYRSTGSGGRTDMDQIEGKTLRELLGDAIDEETEREIDGKMVLVEFWGVWCGPCLSFLPELERLQEKYGEQGFQVLGIHSKRRKEQANDYLAENPKPWPNLIDEEGELQKRFHVLHFPSLYLVDRDGKIRVALAHRFGLDRSIKNLLENR